MIAWGEEPAFVNDIGPWRIGCAVVMAVVYLTSGVWLPVVDAALAR